MKFLLDENIGKEVARFLEQLGHSVSRIRLISPGIEDYRVLDLSISKDSILITSDKDFGELIFKEGQPSTGVIFLRLEDGSSENKIKAIKKILSKHKDIKNKFIAKQQSLFITVKERDGKFRIKVTKINTAS